MLNATFQRFEKGRNMYNTRMLVLPECVPGLVALMEDGMRWLDTLLSGRNTIVPQRFSVADIILFAALDFGRGVGLSQPADLSHLAHWFQETAARPSAELSLHPRSRQTGIHY
jgi:glutathione S-transferase